MEPCLIICGISGNGKTFAARLLSNKLNITQIEFDNIINFFTELTRIKIGERDPKFDLRKQFVQRLPFNSEETYIAFRVACDSVVSRNIEFFKKFYNELVINKKSTMYYTTEDRKLCVDLGKNGEFLVSLAEEFIDITLRYLVKQNESFILEGYNLKEEGYRKAIEKKCQKVNHIECHYKDKKDKFTYVLNGNGIKDISELESSVKKLLKLKRPPYQIFSEKGMGDSKSLEKLEKLGIPKKLENKSVLDLGCNEGFYCFECERRGAKCLGIEKDPFWFSQAAKRKNEFGSFVNFINQSWDWLPVLNHKFDIVLFLAAFHYIKDNQLEVLTNVYNKLNNNGMLILEIGILDKNEGEFLLENVKRPAGDTCQFTNKFAIEKLLYDAGFDEVHHYGKGWDIRGDTVPRYVIHALKTKNPKKEMKNEKFNKIAQEKTQVPFVDIPLSSNEIGETIIRAYKQNVFYRTLIKIGYKILKKKNSNFNKVSSF